MVYGLYLDKKGSIFLMFMCIRLKELNTPKSECYCV